MHLTAEVVSFHSNPEEKNCNNSFESSFIGLGSRSGENCAFIVNLELAG